MLMSWKAVDLWCAFSLFSLWLAATQNLSRDAQRRPVVEPLPPIYIFTDGLSGEPVEALVSPAYAGVYGHLKAILVPFEETTRMRYYFSARITDQVTISTRRRRFWVPRQQIQKTFETLLVRHWPTPMQF